MQKMIYSKYSNERAEEFQVRTDICEKKNGSRFVPKSSEGAVYTQSF